VLLAYEQGASAPPVVITAHEGAGVTRLQIEALPHSMAFVAALEEAANRLLDLA
jgi:dienelactone hydrolase